MYCDLHTHSIFSDGTFTPAEIIELAEKIGLGAVALTDHDSVGGLPGFIEAARNSPVKPVCGTEFSTDWGDKELHIVALFIPEKEFVAVSDYVRDYRIEKDRNNTVLVERLKANGYNIDYDEIKKENPGSLINRAHIATALIKKGYYRTTDEAFADVLSEKKGFYIPQKKPDSYKTISFIKSIGAVPVLAHPFVNMDENELDRFLQQAVEYGLAGIETYCSHYGEDKIKKAFKAAEKYKLLQSGGTDFHGLRKPGIQLGTGHGNLRIPYEIYEKIYKCVAK